MRYAVIAGLLIVATILLLRINTPEPFPDAESYATLRESQIEGGYDSLYAKNHSTNLTDLLFKHVPAQLLLVLLAGITLFALSLFVGSEVFLLLLATSPVFIRVFTTASEAAIGVAAIAIGATLMARRQYWGVLFVPLCFYLGFNLGILASITLITVALVLRMPFVAMGISSFALLSGLVIALALERINVGFSLPQTGQLLGVLTTNTDITIFLIALGAIGFLVLYNHAKSKTDYLLLLMLVPFSIFFEQGTIVIAAFLAYIGSVAWCFLQQRKWQFEEIRTLTLVLIACGILFTALLTVRDRSNIDDDRVALSKFVSGAYPRGTPIAADANIAPLLAYKGYPSGSPAIPAEPDLAAPTLRSEGYVVVATSKPTSSIQHFPIVYRGGAYRVYNVPGASIPAR
jgi:hypothetical protein